MTFLDISAEENHADTDTHAEITSENDRNRKVNACLLAEIRPAKLSCDCKRSAHYQLQPLLAALSSRWAAEHHRFFRLHVCSGGMDWLILGLQNGLSSALWPFAFGTPPSISLAVDRYRSVLLWHRRSLL